MSLLKQTFKNHESYVRTPAHRKPAARNTAVPRIDDLRPQFASKRSLRLPSSSNLFSEHNNASPELLSFAARLFGLEKWKADQEIESEIFDSNYWNLNSVSVICMKFSFLSSGAINPVHNDSTRRFLPRWIDPSILRVCLSLLALIVSICLVVILAGLQSQFLAIKTYVYGDGYYYSYVWRYSRTAKARDRFTPVLAPNGTLLGYTADILGSNRPESEVKRCLGDDNLMPISACHWDPNCSARALWPLVDAAVNNDLNWSFSHCLAWEYAGVCAAVMTASEALDSFPTAGTGLRSWVPEQCQITSWLVEDKGSVTVDDWVSLSVPPDEILVASRAGLIPRRVEPRMELALWITLVLVSEGKDPFHPAADTFSSFLYSRLQYQFVVGFGDAYLVELVAIVALSFYLYTTAFLGEIIQLLHQIGLACHFNCYEAVWLARVAHPPASPPPDSDRPREPDSGRPGLAAYAGWVIGDVACDILLSLRALFVAFMALSSAMIVTMDHGVMPVIFSTLALSYLFDADECLLGALDAVNIRGSRLAAAVVRPGILAFLRAPPSPPREADARPGGRGPGQPESAPSSTGEARRGPVDGEDVAVQGGERTGWVQAAARLALTPAPWGWRVGLWATAVNTGLLANHLMQSILGSTDNQYVVTFSSDASTSDHRLLQIGGGIIAAGACAAASRQGPAALLAAAQLACCFLWVAAVVRWSALFVLCAWYMDTLGGEPDRLWGVFWAGLELDRFYAGPGVGLHVALALLRPLPVLFWVTGLPCGRGQHGPGAESSGATQARLVEVSVVTVV